MYAEFDFSTIEYTDNFLEIINFYLFECPYEKSSHRGKTFTQKGWTKKYLVKLLDAMKDVAGISKEKCVHTSKEEVEKKSKNFLPGEEFLVYSSENGVTKSIFKYIRNAFAHGSFNIYEKNGEKFYYFENQKGGYINAKMSIKEITLLYWIKLFNIKPDRLYNEQEKIIKRIKNK